MKPCPFCGGEATVRYEGHANVLSVGCRECNIRTAYTVADDIGMSEAAAAWNRRTDEKIHCRDCRYYIEDKMPIDPDWPMRCYETGRDILEPWGWCAWAERREDVNERDR